MFKICQLAENGTAALSSLNTNGKKLPKVAFPGICMTVSLGPRRREELVKNLCKNQRTGSECLVQPLPQNSKARGPFRVRRKLCSSLSLARYLREHPPPQRRGEPAGTITRNGFRKQCSQGVLHPDGRMRSEGSPCAGRRRQGDRWSRRVLRHHQARRQERRQDRLHKGN